MTTISINGPYAMKMCEVMPDSSLNLAVEQSNYPHNSLHFSIHFTETCYIFTTSPELIHIITGLPQTPT